MADTISIQAHPDLDPGRVALWDRDDAHISDDNPDGEAFLAKAEAGKDDEPMDVAPTPGVMAALNTGSIVRAEKKASARAGKPPEA